MKRNIRLGILSIAMMLGMIGNAVPVEAVGEPITHLIIAEVSPESSTSASEEYVELFNPTSTDVDATGWQLQYRSSSHSKNDTGSWTTKAILGCTTTKTTDCLTPQSTVVGAGGTLRLSSYESGDGVGALTPGMATTGGELRLIQSKAGLPSSVHDLVGYGDAKDYEGLAATVAPKPGRSIVRNQDGHGVYADTDQNGADFALDSDEKTGSPQAPGTTDNGDGTQQPGTGAGGPVTYLDAAITEVYPDPASPQTDSADEFIEFYNPYGQDLNLEGYVLETGADWSHTYTISGVTISPYGYVALTSAETHMPLSNSGSGVRLYDPNGTLLAEVPSYGTAKTGDSWVQDSTGQWVWTTHPTPGGQNIIDAPTNMQAPKATTATKPKAAKATSATSAKKAAPKKTTSGAVKGTATTAAQSAQASSGGNQAGMWVLAGAGILCVGYALYEYHQDIGDFVRRRWQIVTRMGR